MIRVWGLTLGPLDAKKVRRNVVHAAISGLLDSDHWQSNKLWSIGALENHSSEVAILRITTIGDSVARLVTSALFPGKQLRFGHQEAFVLGPLQLWAEASPKEIADVMPMRALTVNFVTPASFRSGQRSTPLIEPARVLHSLNKRWSLLLGEKSPGLRYAEAAGLTADKAWESKVLSDTWVSSISGKTNPLRISKSLEVAGFTGHIRYNFDSELAAASFTPLWSLASLVGVGSYTTRGLGEIEVTNAIPL